MPALSKLATNGTMCLCVLNPKYGSCNSHGVLAHAPRLPSDDDATRHQRPMVSPSFASEDNRDFYPGAPSKMRRNPEH
jgi:hypothetical protein